MGSTILLAALALTQTPTAQWPAHATMYERTVRQRWMNAHQSPAFTPWASATSVVRFDSATTVTGQTQLFLTTGIPFRLGSARVTLSLDPRGHITSNSDSFLYPALPITARAEDINYADRLRATFDGVLQLPAALAWDLIPGIHPSRLAAGQRWTDTISATTAHAGMTQTVYGMRVNRLIRDTAIGGVTFWFVRDSARMTYTERSTAFERTLRAEVFTDRDVRGVIVGEELVEPATRTLRSRYDTAELHGTATLRYPDGRSFTTPTRLQRTRHITAFDSLAYDSATKARRAAQPRFSMFIFPTGPVEQHLAAGNRQVRDSLLRAYDASRDVEQRAEIRRTLSQWRAEDYRAFQDTLRTIDLRNGDTGRVVSELADPAEARLTPERLHLILPFMRDPGLAFAWGVARDHSMKMCCSGYEKRLPQ